MSRKPVLREVDPRDPQSVMDALKGAVDLKPICVAQWADQQTPARHWLLEDWIPMGRATFLTGDGGTGKSLIAQQLATCVAVGAEFIGLPVRRMNTLYVTCEDDEGELHRRQKAICKAGAIGLDELDKRLFMLSRRGELSNSLVDFAPDESPEISQLYKDLRRTCSDRGIGLLVLDNIAHLFEGNENIRHQVASFCNAMERLATEIGGAVLFLGHPSKAGAQFSGSTAWENQVRARLYLERPQEEGGYSDPDARILSRSKSNYSRSGDALKMHWRDWAFIAHDDHRTAPSMAETARATSENATFLKLLALRNDQQRAISASPHAQNYAPKAMAKMPEAKGMKAPAFERAMERLFSLGTIEEGELWKGRDRHPVKGLRLAGQLRDGCDQTREGMAETGGNPCGTVAREGLRDSATETREGLRETHGNPCGTVAGQCGQVGSASGGGEAPLIGGASPSPIPEDERDFDPFDVGDTTHG